MDDVLRVAQAAVGDIAVWVVGQLLIVGGRACVCALRGHREAGRLEPVEPVIFISGEVVLGVLQGREPAVGGDYGDRCNNPSIGD